ASSILERLHLGAGAQLLEALADRLLRHRRDPQPLDRLRRFRARGGLSEDGLVDGRKDQLAFASGVARVDDAVDVVAFEQCLDQLQLLLRLRVARNELEAVRRHDREVGHGPLLPLLVVLLRLRKLDEVADGPRDRVLIGFEEDTLVARRTGCLRLRLRGLDDLLVRLLVDLLPAALRLDVFELPPLEGTVERAREIAADGRLFCNDEGLGHGKHHSVPLNRGQAGILRRMGPSLFYSFVAVLSWPILKALYRLRAEGEENVPAEGGFVLAANHFSNLDPWPLGMPLWPQRFLRFMAKSELYWWPLSMIIRAGGGFPVRRGERDIEAMNTAVQLAREGNVVAMFPHGTRQRKGLGKGCQRE